jgi:hypothetical protein
MRSIDIVYGSTFLLVARRAAMQIFNPCSPDNRRSTMDEFITVERRASIVGSHNH